MKQVIWKFELLAITPCCISMPQHAEVLTVQVQNGRPYIWARCNQSNPVKDRTFTILPTGVEFESSSFIGDYLGTFQLDGGVFHVFGNRV
jgi:hypothetical protein